MRFWGCLNVAVLALFVGKGFGLPVWQNWMPGDRIDMAVLAFVAAWCLSSSHRASLASLPTTTETGA